MNVLIVTNMAPFVWGGAEELTTNLARQVIRNGHDADVLRIPFQWEPASTIPSQMVLARMLEVTQVDHVIGLKFPAYMVRHSRKSLWLLHQYRQAYDLLDAGQSNISAGEVGDALRASIVAADNETFAEARRIYTNSDVTQSRLAHYNNVHADVLLPPVNDPELFTGGASAGYIFAGGRVNRMKRQRLLIEAVARAPSVRLVIAGPPDTPADGRELAIAVERWEVADRVTLDLRFLDRSEYADYVNGSLAVAYLPYDEDSLGYVSMEAATAAKPLITANDSGGVLGLARDGETGWVTDPDVDALATALTQATADGGRAADRGRALYDRWTRLAMSWDDIVESLLA